jgi:hypothetical protein
MSCKNVLAFFYLIMIRLQAAFKAAVSWVLLRRMWPENASSWPIQISKGVVGRDILSMLYMITGQGSRDGNADVSQNFC